MTDMGKVYLKTVKRSNMAILCDHCDNRIHIKRNNLDKRDYEMFKSTADSWFCIIYIIRRIFYLARRIFYLSAIDMEKLKKELPHQQIFLTLMNFFI